MKTYCAAVLAGLALLSSCDKDKEKAEPQLSYRLDDSSLATWQGHQRTGYFNEGTIAVQSEQPLLVRNGKVQSGTFTMPLASLQNLNLPDNLKPVLIAHLQSADFFNMALHPSLRFVITQVTPYRNNADAAGIAGANYLVRGNLTLVGQTHPLSFPAKIDLTAQTIAVQADLKVDRTQWGITYASDPTQPDEHYILPDMTLHLDVHGNRAAQ